MNKNIHTIYILSFLIVGISATILLGIYGYQYYSTSLEERVFHTQHTILKPSGDIGHGLGILGSLMMTAGVAIYMIRKRIRWLFRFGYLKHWLEFHIFLCSMGPALVLYHTAFKFGGIVAVSFWSMIAVVISGIIGRFIYVQIPHSIQGQVLSFKDLNEISNNLTNHLKNNLNVKNEILLKLEKYSNPDKFRRINFRSGLLFLFKDYFHTRSVIRKLKRELISSSITKKEIKEIIETIKSKLILSRRIGLLQTMQKIFRYWHIVHLPFAITMFVIMFLHIAITVAFGYKWIF